MPTKPDPTVSGLYNYTIPLDFWGHYPVTPAIPTPAPVDPRYPHKCPKCKAPCYIGLNQIEHQAKDFDKTCQ